MDEMDALTSAHITAAEATFESDPESRKAEKEFEKAMATKRQHENYNKHVKIRLEVVATHFTLNQGVQGSSP